MLQGKQIAVSVPSYEVQVFHMTVTTGKNLSTVINLVTFQYVKTFPMRQVVKLTNAIQFFDVV